VSEAGDRLVLALTSGANRVEDIADETRPAR
jgi:hypothetical protein